MSHVRIVLMTRSELRTSELCKGVRRVSIYRSTMWAVCMVSNLSTSRVAIDNNTVTLTLTRVDLRIQYARESGDAIHVVGCWICARIPPAVCKPPRE
jgi:hypothetical protein